MKLTLFEICYVNFPLVNKTPIQATPNENVCEINF